MPMPKNQQNQKALAALGKKVNLDKTKREFDPAARNKPETPAQEMVRLRARLAELEKIERANAVKSKPIQAIVMAARKAGLRVGAVESHDADEIHIHLTNRKRVTFLLSVTPDGKLNRLTTDGYKDSIWICDKDDALKDALKSAVAIGYREVKEMDPYGGY